MRVLLISPNREHLPDPVFPLGLAYISAAVKRQGHDVKVVDLCFSDDIDKDIKECVKSFEPEIVGISLRNVDDVAYPKRHSYLQEYTEAVETIRKYTDALVMLGGSGFTIMPEHFMKKLHADFGIVGEGEKAFPDFIEKIKNDRDIKKSPLKIQRIFSSRTRIKNIDDITPDRTVFDNHMYYRAGGMLNIQTKRGCPFNCIYCTYPGIEGKKVRMRDPSSVADEIENIVNSTGIRHFFIVDSIFNYPLAHAKAVCDEIIKRRLNIKWSCYANPAFITEGLADAMANAGCTGIEFGTDSLVDECLAVMGKNFTFDMIKKASSICKKHSIKFCHFIFVGGPGDSDRTVRTNISRLDEINPDAAVIMAGIRIFPGTRLEELAKKDLGISDIGLKPVFYLSKNIADFKSIVELVSKRRHWIMPGYEINMYPRLQRKLREHGFKGSLWEELSKR